MAGRTALVTGSSRGIGFGIARELAQAGFNIVLNSPAQSEAMEKAENAVRATGAGVRTCFCDISRIERHADFVGEVFAAFGNLHCLVNNAGIAAQRRGDLLDMTVESFDEQIAVNLRGTFFLTQAIARKMLDSSSAAFRSIVTVSSSNAAAAAIERGEYCMSKSALTMMNKLFAIRLAEAGINTYEIRPGLIDTDMTRAVKPRYDALLEKGFSPINRWGEPEDVGECVVALAEGKMKFSTGDTFHIDGGLLIQRY